MAALFLMVGVVGAGASAPPLPPSGFEAVFERVLPAPIGWALDVRWVADDRVIVATASEGIFELSVSNPETPPRRMTGSEVLRYSGALALSDSYVATAFPLGVVGWRKRGPNRAWQQDTPMAVIVDFDVHQEDVLLLGARRVGIPGEKQPQWAPHGGILFRGDLSEALSDLDLVLTAQSGADGMAMEMAFCHVLDLGAVRFLSGGRSVVIPGVQPGVFVYGPDGRLVRAWSGASLGIYDDCDIDETTKETVSADPHARIAWWQRHTILDDLVPWGEWFAAVVRTPRRGGAAWTFHPFTAEGPGAAVPLPVTGEAAGFHLRADSRDDRLALLLYDIEPTSSKGPPKHRPRLLVLKRTMQ